MYTKFLIYLVLKYTKFHKFFNFFKAMLVMLPKIICPCSNTDNDQFEHYRNFVFVIQFSKQFVHQVELHFWQVEDQTLLGYMILVRIGEFMLEITQHYLRCSKKMDIIHTALGKFFIQVWWIFLLILKDRIEWYFILNLFK